MDVDCCIAFEVEAGRIVSGREHFDDLYAWDAFWAWHPAVAPSEAHETPAAGGSRASGRTAHVRRSRPGRALRARPGRHGPRAVGLSGQPSNASERNGEPDMSDATAHVGRRRIATWVRPSSDLHQASPATGPR